MPFDGTIPKKVSVEHEPEIQYAATDRLLRQVEAWVLKNGGHLRKEDDEDAIYFDTKNNRLIREGIECRMKPKGALWRVDLKIPDNPDCQTVVPDEHGILHRTELKHKTDSNEPALSMFTGQDLLDPVQSRVKRFFDKQLEPRFRMKFKKKKFIRDIGGSEIEYSLQQGRIENMDGTKSTDSLFILELELREGKMQDLLQSKEELESVFLQQGLDFLPRRKVLIGFDLIKEDMTDKARGKLEKAFRCHEQTQSAPIPAAA